MKKKILYITVITITILLVPIASRCQQMLQLDNGKTMVFTDEVDTYCSQLKSGDPLAVQYAKDYIFRRYEVVSPEARKRIEDKLIDIINENKQSILDTVSDHVDTVSNELLFNYKNLPSESVLILRDGKRAAMFLTGSLRITPLYKECPCLT